MVSSPSLNGIRISEALNADIEDLSTERGHQTQHSTPVSRGVMCRKPQAMPTLALTMRRDRASRSLDRYAT